MATTDQLLTPKEEYWTVQAIEYAIKNLHNQLVDGKQFNEVSNQKDLTVFSTIETCSDGISSLMAAKEKINSGAAMEYMRVNVLKRKKKISRTGFIWQQLKGLVKMMLLP